MNKVCTNFEQTKKLLALGLDPGLANWRIKLVDTVKGEIEECPRFTWSSGFYLAEKNELPAWGLRELLDVLKNRSDYLGITFKGDSLVITFYKKGNSNKQITGNSENLIDLIVNLIIELVEEKIISLD